MKWVLVLLLGSTLAASTVGAPLSYQSSKGTTKTRPKSANSLTHHPSAHVARARYTRKKRVPPAPSYQLHPDPERYQQIQQALADRGYFKGDVNGVWGDDSVDALKRFQADQKLDNDGKINALSLIDLGLGPKHDGTKPPPSPQPDPNSASNPSSPDHF